MLKFSMFARAFYCLSLAIILFIHIGCESCTKTYSFSGRVADNSGNPVSGIEVIFTRGQATSQGTTGADGTYSFSFSTKGDLTGFQIGFNQNGAEVATSEALTSDEVNTDSCDEHSPIVRNVELP